jgi:hypothetical protein
MPSKGTPATVRDSTTNRIPVPQPSDPWAFFDRIYCITIDDRLDRRRQAQGEFAAVGLAERVEFVIVRKHPFNRVQGIYESHLTCLDRGLAAGAETILVFEDDVIFRRFDAQALSRACAVLQGQGDWDGLFLGCIVTGSSPANGSLSRINYRCLAHAYALQADFARQVVSSPWSGVPFDEMLRRSAGRYFGLSPMCAFQGLAGTDNQTLHIHRIRRLCGGLPLIQRVNELWHRHLILFYLLHLVVVGLAIGLLCLW